MFSSGVSATTERMPSAMNMDSICFTSSVPMPRRCQFSLTATHPR